MLLIKEFGIPKFKEKYNEKFVIGTYIGTL
jgi:hypothetical protein